MGKNNKKHKRKAEKKNFISNRNWTEQNPQSKQQKKKQINIAWSKYL